MAFLILKSCKSMLFILSDELIVDRTHNKYNNIMRAVKKIATSVFESKHLLSGSIHVLTYFRDYFNTDEDLYCLFNFLVNNYYSTSYDFIKRRVEVVIDITIDKRYENGYEIYQSKIDDYQDTSFCQRTILIGEDLNDCIIYEIILRRYIKEKELNINYQFEFENGGGQNCCKVIEKNIRDKKIFLSILDTDRKYPKADIGSTLKSCKKFFKLNNAKFTIIELDVHEIENLLPFNLMDNEDCDGELKLKKEKFDLLRKNGPELLQFFDIKHGIKKQDIKGDEEYKNFAQKCCECDNSITNFEEYYNNLEDDNYIYLPLCRIFKKIRQQLENDNTQLILLDFQKQEWEKLGKNLLEFGCARNKEALN